ncbi:hypothetical protein [Lysobacter enzymogenes]|uniref:hypothetical protein n=1 Tax=Lysobacter enzymogenes TaxID=69 RepID=UPI001AF9EBBA|nr:hypothetical protein [Lysobacter enzymogenes]QQQ02754.1 hypothetical protein JHW41_07230 [Lysobacter enzymogenes]
MNEIHQQRMLALKSKPSSEFDKELATLLDAENVYSYLSLLDTTIYHYYERAATEPDRYHEAVAELTHAFGQEKWSLISEAVKKPYRVLIEICEQWRIEKPSKSEDFSEGDVYRMALNAADEENVLEIFQALPDTLKFQFDLNAENILNTDSDKYSHLDIIKAARIFRDAKLRGEVEVPAGTLEPSSWPLRERDPR